MVFKLESEFRNNSNNDNNDGNENNDKNSIIFI